MRQTQRSPEGPRHLHRIPRLSEAMAADGDWQDFYEFQEPARSLQDQENCNASPEAGAGPGGGGDGFPALACHLEEKLSQCFRPSGPGAEPPRAAVRPITECSLLQGDE